jgi:Tfp pilus tip-associated adhesin PilY1
MHAFRGYDGEELYAYIPADILGDWAGGETPDSRNTLRDLVALLVAENNGVHNHKYFIAGSATVEDVFLQTDSEWHTALAFGRGRGGKFITSLDVSNVGDWDPATVFDRLDFTIHFDNLPRLMFNVGNRQGIGDIYDGLGETWSIPVMGNVLAPSPQEDQWVLFVGGGYGCENPATGEGQWLYVLRMEDGSVWERFQADNDPDAPIPWNGLVATPARYNPAFEDPDFLDTRDYTSRIYIADLQGRVYKLDCYHEDTNQWTFEVFYEMERDQPVTTMAALKKLQGQQTVLVYVGTGGDARVSTATTQFQVLGIVDNDAEGANNPGNTNLPGWVFPLPEGERVIADPIVGGNRVFFATTWTEINLDECFIQFFSRLYSIEADTGSLGLFDLDVDTGAVDNPLELGEGKVTGLFFRDEHLYVSKSGGLETQGETMVLGRGEFEPPEGGIPPGTVQVLVRGFRISPF